jgi:hypothetical protein
MKVAINKNEGMMFDLSHEAVLMYFGLRGQKIYLEQLTDVDSDGYILASTREKREIKVFVLCV